MIDRVLADVREELLGTQPRQTSVDNVIRAPIPDETFPTLSSYGDPFIWLHEMVIFLIHLMYHRLFDNIESLMSSVQLHRAEMLKVSEVSFDFAFQKNQYDACFKMLDYFGLDTGRTTKIMTKYIHEYLEQKEYQKASELWGMYKNKGVLEKAIMEDVERVFRRIANSLSSEVPRNYKPMFQLVELFNIPKSATHWIGIEQYNFTMQNKDFYMAALIAKKLKLPASYANKAGFESCRYMFGRVREHIANGAYKDMASLSPADPYAIAKSLIEEFNLFDYKGQGGNKDNTLIKKLSEMAYDLFVDLLNIGESSGNAPLVIYSLGIQILRDFQLLNDAVHPTVAQNTQSILEKLVDSIAITINENVDIQAYYPIMKELRTLYRGDYTRLDPLIINLTSKALAQKEIELANKFYVDFHLPIVGLSATVFDLIMEWMRQGDFDSILLVLKYFPIYHELKKNEAFMVGLLHYYKETVKSQKFLKSLTIAEAFHLERSFLLEPVRLHIQGLLGKGNVEGAKIFIKKYRLRRREYLPVVKKSYFAVLQTNKLFAERFRSELKLSIFDVGVKNWLLYELLGLPLPEIQKKNMDSVEAKEKTIIPSK